MDATPSGSVAGAPPVQNWKKAFSLSVKRDADIRAQAIAILRPELTESQKETLDTLRTTLDSMKQAAASAREAIPAQRKAMALQKIEQIKAAIDALKLSVAGDPRLVARMASRLARELAAAVKDYVTAGGTTGGTSSDVSFGASSTSANTRTNTSDTLPQAAQETAPRTRPNILSFASDDMPEDADTVHSGNLWPTRPMQEYNATQSANAAYRKTQSAGSDEADPIIAQARELLKKLREHVAQAREYHRIFSETTPERDTSHRAVIALLQDADDALDSAARDIAFV